MTPHPCLFAKITEKLNSMEISVLYTSGTQEKVYFRKTPCDNFSNVRVFERSDIAFESYSLVANNAFRMTMKFIYVNYHLTVSRAEM